MKGLLVNKTIELESQLKCIGLKKELSYYEEILKEATEQEWSYTTLFKTIIQKEYTYQMEQRCLNRLKESKIPIAYSLATFPFEKQPKLKKQVILEHYETLRYLTDKQVLLFIGPTGCGKTGLATSYLTHALNHNYRGLFIDYKILLDRLYQSLADGSEQKVLSYFERIDCLLIDEVGYGCIEKEKAALFFTLLKRRHKKKCTLLTTQHGLKEWNNFLQDPHITAAIIDRITENCILFNMLHCLSIREKKIIYAAEE